MLLNALIRLAFATPPLFVKLATQRKSLTPLYKRYAVTEQVRSHCLYACGFRIYFTPLPGFFSPFPHGTSSLSVDHEYLALEDGPPMFRQGFTCPALLFANLVPQSRFHIRGYHPLRPDFPFRSINVSAITSRLIPFARHYLGNLG